MGGRSDGLVSRLMLEVDVDNWLVDGKRKKNFRVGL